MKLRDVYEVPIGFMIAIVIGNIVLHSKPVQDEMRKAIKKEYDLTGRISFAAWWLHPVYCAKLYWGSAR